MSEASSHKPLPAAASSGSSSPPPKRPDASGSSSAGLDDGQQTVISSGPPAPDLEFPRQLPVESGDLWEGEQLGQFLLQRFIGGGGMGIVFRALDTTLGREVAVKVLSRDQSADDETLRRFRNEAQSAARLNHDNIAHVFFVGEDRGVNYIVFEFIEGINIRDLVEQHGPLPLEEAISYTHQIAQALDHASERAVIHRDIKPSNVLITPDGKAKLVDMGLARSNQLAAAGDDLTASGVTLGTFDYISPEQARDPRSADVRSDLYSLGCSLFFMLTGRPPFPEGTVLQKLLQHQGDSPPDPRVFRPELPPEVTRVLARLLAKNPTGRYQRPAELIDDLSALAETLGIQLGSSHAAWITPRKRNPFAQWQHHLPWIVPIAALLLIVFALDFYWSGSPADTAGATLGPGRGPPPKQSRRQAPPPANPPLPVEETGPPAPGLLPGESDDVTAGSEPRGETPAPAGAEPDPWQLLSEIATKLVPPKQPPEGASPPVPPPDEIAVDDPPADNAEKRSLRSSPVARAADRKEPLSVGDSNDPNSYTSLRAACSEAADGDVIELRYNGRRAERPIEISNIDLTIRNGAGYEPIVVFEPPPDSLNITYHTAMMSVAGGKLSTSGVHWEFEPPRDDPAEMALFETRRCELLELKTCTLTIRGGTAYRGRRAFFDIKAAPAPDGMGMNPGSVDRHVVNIDLQNCVVRGEGTLLRDNDLQAVRLRWNNGLLATSERLFAAKGSSLQPRQDLGAELTLNHVTIMAAGGLVLLTNSEEAPYQLQTDVTCNDCIIATTARPPSGAPPLVVQRGSDGIDDYLARFAWHGDYNYFHGFDVFWLVMNATGQSGSKQVDFDEWDGFWRGQSKSQRAGPNAVVWRNAPGDKRPFHTHTPDDYRLDATGIDNGAVGGAADGLDAGGELDYLPKLPDPNQRRASSQSEQSP